MDKDSLNMVSKEVTSFDVDKSVLSNGVKFETFATEHCPIFASLSECRRAIKGNAISINKQKVSDQDFSLNHENLIKGEFIMIENGKKNKFMVKAK